MNHTKETYRQNYMVLGGAIRSFYDKLISSNATGVIIEKYSHVEMDIRELLRQLILADTLKAVERSENYSCTPHEMEAFDFLLFSMQDDDNLTFEIWHNNDEIQEQAAELCNALRESFPHDNEVFGAFQLVNVLSDCGLNDIAEEYFNYMYELVQCVTYADGNVSKLESVWIEVLDFFKPIIHSRAQITQMQREYAAKKEEDHDECSPDEYGNEYLYNQDAEEEEAPRVRQNDDDRNPIDVLTELIGLEPVKTDVKSLRNLLHMQRLRESKGLKAAKVSYHCVFTGNPGTGKTTVARILASIYKDLGILKSGHLVETDRSGLVADYVGQTATKTNAIIDKAIDGVLFIDEAYALAQGGDQDFGREAISTLLKRMEDDRDRLVVILAGYNKEMEEFISTNSGLQSRFSRYINFPDYEINELCDIFRLFLKQNDYVIEKDAMDMVERIITDAYNNKDYKFGNARYVRNLFETVITNQANRLAIKDNISKEEMLEITINDI